MPTTANPERMLRAALRYAASGWYVFPLATHGDVKAPHPMLGEHEGHRQATLDPNTIERWWKREPQAGIGCWLAASGLIVVDVDPRAGGPTALEALEAAHGRLDTPLVCVTGGDGRHHYYRAPEGCSPPGKVHRQKGLDLKFNGYVVLPPSAHAAKGPDGKFKRSPRRYQWPEGRTPFQVTDIPEIPAWVLRRDTPPVINGHALNGHALNGHSHNGHEIDIFAEDTPPVGLSPDKLRSLLAEVPNEGINELDYEDWLQVMAGIYHETDGSEEGRQIAEEWSSQALKHVDEDFAKKWASLSIEGKGRAPTTARFILKLAKEARAVVAAETMKDLQAQLAAAASIADLEAASAAIKAAEVGDLQRDTLTYRVQTVGSDILGHKMSIGRARSLTRHENPAALDLPPWLEGWAYCAEDDKFHHARLGAFGRLAFNGLFNAEMLTRRDKLEGRGIPELTAADAALNRFEIPKVHGRRYLPEIGEFFEIGGAKYLNTYRETEQPQVPKHLTDEDRENVARVEAHFEFLIPDRRSRETVLSWLAHITQTRSRPTWAIVLQGPEGDGKSFVVQLMAIVLGRSNVHHVNVSIIESDFNGWAEGGLIKGIDELKMHGHNRFDTLNKLKELIANPMIAVHRKGLDPYDAYNTAGYFVTTNFRDAMPITEGDSRYFMIASPRQTRAEVVAHEKANPGYFDLLFAALAESPGALRQYFLEYPIASHFKPNGRAPASAEHAHAAALNSSDEQDALTDALATGKPGLGAGLLDTSALVAFLYDAGVPVPQTRALNRLLVQEGFTYLGRFKVDGEMRRFWTRTPDRFGKTEATRSARIREWLSDEDL